MNQKVIKVIVTITVFGIILYKILPDFWAISREHKIMAYYIVYTIIGYHSLVRALDSKDE